MKHDPGSDFDLAGGDRGLIDAIDRAYAPAPLSAARQAAFRRALGDRLRRRARVWTPAVSFGATAVAAAILWLGLVQSGPPDQSRIVDVDGPGATALYAFVDPDFDDGDQARAADFLPDDYLALAGAFDVPLDDL